MPIRGCKNMQKDILQLCDYIPNLTLWEKDLKSLYQKKNLTFSNLCGFKKIEDIFQVSDYNIPCKISESAEIWQQNDRKVILAKKAIQFFEILIYSDEKIRLFFTTKTPKLNEKNEVIGTYGHSLDVSNLFSQLPKILNRIGGKNNSISQNAYVIGDHSGFHLTFRQSKCLFFVIRGKTSKEIAKILNLSFRTIEFHIEELKNKFNCKTKNDLIDAAIAYGFVDIIPKHLFTEQLSILLA
jgi:DNA-binding CsgD family transcriptional regulator